MRCAHNNIEAESPCLACEIERLQAENAALKEALEFYADPGSWEPIQSADITFAAIDESDIDRVAGANVPIGGKRARNTISAERKEK